MSCYHEVVDVPGLESDAVHPTPDESTPLCAGELIAGVVLAPSSPHMKHCLPVMREESRVEKVQDRGGGPRVRQPDEVPAHLAICHEEYRERENRGEEQRPRNHDGEELPVPCQPGAPAAT